MRKLSQNAHLPPGSKSKSFFLGYFISSSFIIMSIIAINNNPLALAQQNQQPGATNAITNQSTGNIMSFSPPPNLILKNPLNKTTSATVPSMLGSNSSNNLGPPLHTPSNNITTTTANLLPYENSTLGISLQYPSNWTIGVGPFGERNVVGFYPPHSSLSAKFTPVVSVDVSQLPPGYVSRFGGPALASLHYKNEIVRSAEKYGMIVNEGRITLGVYPGFKVIAIFKPMGKNAAPGVQVEGAQLFTIHNGTAYLVNYLADSTDYQKYLPGAQKIVDSFRITNNTLTMPATKTPELPLFANSSNAGGNIGNNSNAIPPLPPPP